MGDAENALPASKKRAAGTELSRDNPGLDDDDDASEQELGTFKKASAKVLATRRIVKPRCNQTPASASSNPFANISLVPPIVTSTKVSEFTAEEKPVDEGTVPRKVDEKFEDIITEKAPEVTKANKEVLLQESTDDHEVESVNTEKIDSVGKMSNADETDEKEPTEGAGEAEEAKKDDGQGDASPSVAPTPLNSFQQLSSNQNAFTGLAGTGFSSCSFSFGLKSENATFPSFNFGSSSNGSSSLFGNAGASDVSKSEAIGLPSMQEVPLETGEENEKAVFNADAVLFEYLDGGWKERGKGELKVNASTTGTERARLVMRARGNYRLILNASLYPDMKLTNMEKRGITFVCMNSAGDGKDGLATFALKFKDGSAVEEFRTAVTLHKGKKSEVLKTPENAPKATDD